MAGRNTDPPDGERFHRRAKVFGHKPPMEVAPPLSIPSAADRTRGVRPLAVPLAAGASLCALFILTRPYLGIIQDAVLYVGRAMADRDPGGLGQDILFAFDGQSRFSAFPNLLDGLVAALGPDVAAASLGRLAPLLWLAAAAAFASRIAPSRRLLWAMLAVAAVAPATYGGDGGFRFAEPYAIPRPFAEAGVLAGLALALAGRQILAGACLLGAALIHPIMAAPGLAVLFVTLAMRDRRWLWAGGAGLAVLLAAAGSGVPFAARLFTSVDPAWRHAIGTTNVSFPSRWPATVWAAIAVDGATVALAARALDGNARRLFVAVLVVAISGIAISALFGDGLSSLLVLQVQPWRALWLLRVVAVLGLPVFARAAWHDGPAGQFALACLALAWLGTQGSAPAPLVAGAACAAILVSSRGYAYPRFVTSATAQAAWLAVVLFGLTWWVAGLRFALSLWADAPPEAAHLAAGWLTELAKPAVAAVAVAWGMSHRRRLHPALAVTCAAALVLGAAMFGDARSGLTRRLDTWQADPALLSLLPAGNGEVLWIRGGVMPPWVLAGRPNWVSATQASSVLFSRDLARVWSERTDRLIAAGLGDASDRSPNLRMAERRDLAPRAADLAAFCAAPDAPVAIVAPLDRDVRLPDGVAYSLYRLPRPDIRFDVDASGVPVWSGSERFALIACRLAQLD